MKEPNVILDLNNIRGKNRSHDPIKKDKIGNDPLKFSCEWIKDALNLDIVNPNSAKLKTAGYVGNISAILGITSVILTTILLFTR